MFRGGKDIFMKRVVIILVLVGLAVTTPGCQKETEQDKVKKVITDIQKSVEEKDIRKIVNKLSKSYNDPQGLDYNAIKGLLLGYFYQHPKISAYVTDLEITLETTTAKALFQAVLTGGNKTGSAADLIPESLGVYAFEILLNKEQGDWKVVSAKWKRAGNDQ